MAANQLTKTFQSAFRQALLVEFAYPYIERINMLWYMFPDGRPDGLSLGARYVLFVYRCAVLTCEEIAADLISAGEEQLLASLESESRYLWNMERESIRPKLLELCPSVQELTELAALFADTDRIDMELIAC